MLSQWLLERRRRRSSSAGHEHHHAHHDGQVSAACFEESGWFLEEPLLALLDRERANLLRVKGFVALKGRGERALVELAGGHIEVRAGGPWEQGDSPRTELVLIGEGLDEAALRRQIWACRARD